MSSKTSNPPLPFGTEEFTYPQAPPGIGSDGGEGPQGKQRRYAKQDAHVQTDPVAAAHREQQAWIKGVEAGKAEERVFHEQQLAKQRDEIAKALRDFAAERDSYFHAVEEQVVRLALAIVRKILHRESQIDPLLLTGVLRVALEKVGANTNTRMRANSADITVWRDYFAQARENFPTPELIADLELEPGRCILETELGTTEIGLDTQLKEIEQGFLDLLAQRPGHRG